MPQRSGACRATLYPGRFAGAGYSFERMALIGTRRLSSPRSSASSCIATAKSYQLATPASDQCWIPKMSGRLHIVQIVRAREPAQVGDPT